MKINKNKLGFSVIELLVVVVVIGIITVATVISVKGITKKNIEVSLKTDLDNAASQLSIDYFSNKSYPATLDDANGGRGLSKGTGVEFTYELNNNNYCISGSMPSSNVGPFHISSKSGVIESGSCPVSLAVSDPANWIQIGTQVWAKYNLNVGVRIASATEQTDNPGVNIVEKYCYGDTDAGCTNLDPNGIPYGGLYQRNEAMGYTTTEGVQGICPTGSHIPTDVEWKTLEMQLGMSQEQADLEYAWRGTTQGTQLKSGVGGTSGLNVPLAGLISDGSFGLLSSSAFLLSSSNSGGYALIRSLYSGYTTIDRSTANDSDGISVRCLEN